MAKAIDLTGQLVNSWYVIEKTGHKNGRQIWKCRCKCGNIRELICAAIKRQKTCGCFRKKHGHSPSKNQTVTTEYNSWQAAKKRCNNPSDKDFYRYGYRGITWPVEWNDFTVFLEDMGPKPSAKHTLDRIDNEKGYYKRNCKWSTPHEQAKNRRSTKTYFQDRAAKNQISEECQIPELDSFIAMLDL